MLGPCVQARTAGQIIGAALQRIPVYMHVSMQAHCVMDASSWINCVHSLQVDHHLFSAENPFANVNKMTDKRFKGGRGPAQGCSCASPPGRNLGGVPPCAACGCKCFRMLCQHAKPPLSGHACGAGSYGELKAELERQRSTLEELEKHDRSKAGWVRWLCAGI